MVREYDYEKLSDFSKIQNRSDINKLRPKKKEFKTAICRYCGKEFKQEIKHNIRYYCSKICYGK